jgi:hypothetical protein
MSLYSEPREFTYRLRNNLFKSGSKFVGAKLSFGVERIRRRHPFAIMDQKCGGNCFMIFYKLIFPHLKNLLSRDIEV